MPTKTEYRVPLLDILGIPAFHNNEHKEQWCRDNKVELIEDWAGRESVDVATAWRLKADYDKFIARARKVAAEQAAEQEQIRQAQRDREVQYAELVRQHSVGRSVGEAAAIARVEIEKQEHGHLPASVRQRLYWPVTIPLVFN